jgi:lycopene cyclase CruA
MTKPSSRWPLTEAALTPEALAHVRALEAGFSHRKQSVRVTDDGPARGVPDYDLVLAGGGLSLVYGAYLARAGLRVAVFDQRRVGAGHREWNISRRELVPLVASGLFTDEEVRRLVLLEYQRGIVHWHGGGVWPVREVLDCVVDAQGLLTRLRRLCADAGAEILDGHRLTAYHVGRAGVRIDLETPHGPEALTARLLVDGTGASSPHAAFDLCCPTVGGVLTGLDQGPALDQVDPQEGEILFSTEGVEENRQHIWEGFPGPDGRYTIYLFYYAEPDTLSDHPLLDLYERFFRLRPRYKRGDAKLEKATYGFIPAYTRLRPTPAAPSDRVVLVGDAAGRHSPLTFCGFGSMIRSFLPVADALRARLADDRLSRRALAQVWREPPGLRVMGGLTLMMIPPDGRGAAGPARGEEEMRGPAEINRLLDAAFGTLADLGQDTYAAFVRDEIGARDFLRFMRATAKKRPTIYREVFSHLTPAEIATWSMQMVTLAATKRRTG